MKVLLVRHADAGDPGEWLEQSSSDDLRPLSKKGSDQIKRMAPLLRDRWSQAMILASPLVRAQQTAYDLMERGVGKTLETELLLRPEVGLESWTSRFDEMSQASDRWVLVGHNPQLTYLGCWMMGFDSLPLALKKSGWMAFEGLKIQGSWEFHLTQLFASQFLPKSSD